MKNYQLNTKAMQQTTFIPIETDDLFWCLFIGHFGKNHYETISCNQRKNRELSEKENIMKFITDQKDITEKKKKILVSILSTEKTTIELLSSICRYYNISVFYIDESNTYYESYNNSTHIYIIQQYKHKHSIDFDSTIDKISVWKKNSLIN
jgi:hypothetical protein